MWDGGTSSPLPPAEADDRSPAGRGGMTAERRNGSREREGENGTDGWMGGLSEEQEPWGEV